MKILCIGDIHQTNNWKRFNFNNYSKIIFLGDFVDDFNSDWNKLNPLKNMEEILSLQKSNPKKFVVLLGNHDFQYLDLNEHYSGKQINKEIDLHEFYKKHLKEFRIVYQLDNILFSHAGISSKWCEDYAIEDINTINSLLWNKVYGALSFYPYDMSGYGLSKHQSPIWIRPEALCMYPWKNYTQIVGHTCNKGEHGVAKFTMKNNQELIVVDNITHNAYYEFELKK